MPIYRFVGFDRSTEIDLPVFHSGKIYIADLPLRLICRVHGDRFPVLRSGKICIADLPLRLICRAYGDKLSGDPELKIIL